MLVGQLGLAVVHTPHTNPHGQAAVEGGQGVRPQLLSLIRQEKLEISL